MKYRAVGETPGIIVPGTASAPVLGNLVTSEAAATYIDQLTRPDHVRFKLLQGDFNERNKRIGGLLRENCQQDVVAQHLGWTLLHKTASFVLDSSRTVDTLEIPNVDWWNGVDAIYRNRVGDMLSDYADTVERIAIPSVHEAKLGSVIIGSIQIEHTSVHANDEHVHSHYDFKKLPIIDLRVPTQR